jgi:hypothetical protein
MFSFHRIGSYIFRIELIILEHCSNLVGVTTGWERMVLQILFLGPSNLLEPNASFAQMSQKLIVSPIVKTLVFSKVPEKVCSCGEWKL